jgi:hypothetical protein
MVAWGRRNPDIKIISSYCFDASQVDQAGEISVGDKVAYALIKKGNSFWYKVATKANYFLMFICSQQQDMPTHISVENIKLYRQACTACADMGSNVAK